MNLFWNLLYPYTLSIWRRCFGCSGWDLIILKNRFIQHCIGFINLFHIQMINGVDIVANALSCLVFQGLFWARSHGCCFDYGHGTVDLTRYDQLWYWKYIKKIIPQSEWYTFTGDYILMCVRYTLPAILMSIILLEPSVSMMGLVLSSVYAMCWKLYDWKLMTEPTDKAEWITGFLIGMFFIVL
jgi:hypothetical protein